eukprot:1836960-Rhodomonas_salina.2
MLATVVLDCDGAFSKCKRNSPSLSMPTLTIAGSSLPNSVSTGWHSEKDSAADLLGTARQPPPYRRAQPPSRCSALSWQHQRAQSHSFHRHAETPDTGFYARCQP